MSEEHLRIKKCQCIFGPTTLVYLFTTLSVIVLLNMITANNHLSSIIDISKDIRQSLGNLVSNETYVLKARETTKLNHKPVTRLYTRISPTTPKTRPDDCIACFTHTFKYLISNDKICQTGRDKADVNIIVLISTVHDHLEQRRAIRETWLAPTKNNTADIRYAFLLGSTSNKDLQKKVEKENAIYKDILQEDFVDSYYNLTYKTVFAFKWATTKCSNAKFFMKTDDDMYVNFKSLKFVTEFFNEVLQKRLGGNCRKSIKPIRDKKSKWFTSHDMYPHNTFPGYCSGTGYITSMKVARQIYDISKNVPFFHLEDIYIALCVQKLGLDVYKLKGFNSGKVDLGCIYKNRSLVTSHRLTPDVIRSAWNIKC